MYINHAPYDRPVIPELPNVPEYGSITCPVCKIEFKGAFGYVCPNQTCPIQPKVTC